MICTHEHNQFNVTKSTLQAAPKSDYFHRQITQIQSKYTNNLGRHLTWIGNNKEKSLRSFQNRRWNGKGRKEQ